MIKNYNSDFFHGGEKLMDILRSSIRTYAESVFFNMQQWLNLSVSRIFASQDVSGACAVTSKKDEYYPCNFLQIVISKDHKLYSFTQVLSDCLKQVNKYLSSR